MYKITNMKFLAHILFIFRQKMSRNLKNNTLLSLINIKNKTFVKHKININMAKRYRSCFSRNVETALALSNYDKKDYMELIKNELFVSRCVIYCMTQCAKSIYVKTNKCLFSNDNISKTMHDSCWKQEN